MRYKWNLKVEERRRFVVSERPKEKEKIKEKKNILFLGWDGGGGNGLNEWRASCCTSFSVLVVSLRGGLPGAGGGRERLRRVDQAR